MCTVSYYPGNGSAIITSNRDEHVGRPHAWAPTEQVHGHTVLYYPKDPRAGGTWFCVSEHGHVFVLLNGAVEKHISRPPYRLSRGQVLLQLAASTNWLQYWQHTSMLGIEPFTVVCYTGHTLVQLQWNGIQQTLQYLPADVPHIWSSATLYTAPVIQARAQWYARFIAEQVPGVTPESLLYFHGNTQPGDQHNGLVINRNNTMITRSITQCVLQPGSFTLHHHDLVTKAVTHFTKQVNETLVA